MGKRQIRLEIVFQYFLIFLQIIQIIYGYEEFGQKLDYISLPYKDTKNISCVAHDASFICDCHNVDENLFLPPLDGNVFQVLVRNCESIEVGPYLLENVQGFKTVTFQNIRDLTLKENSLAYQSLSGYRRLTFEQVQTIQISSHAISGNIEEILFQSSGIQNIQAYGITTKSPTGIIKFDSMYIDVIDRHAFKKFTMEQLIITNTVLTANLPSQSFYEIKTQQLLIQNVTFREVYFNAFHFEEINMAAIRDNNFIRVNSDWISAGIKSGVVIENNNFGETNRLAFAGLYQHKDYVKSTKIELRLNENIIRQVPSYNEEVQPLKLDGNFNIMIRNLTYLNHFPCNIKDKLDKNSFFKIFSDTIYFQTKKDPSKLQSVRKIFETECEEISYLPYIIGGSVALIILIILIAAIIVWYIMKKKAAQKLNINDPEPRTYEETQIVLKVENAGLLKTDL